MAGVKKKELVKLEETFGFEYLSNGRNAHKAYQVIRPNVSIGSARVGGSKFLKRAGVQALIDREIEKVKKTPPPPDLRASRDQCLEDIENARLLAEKQGNVAHICKCVDLKNKMMGHYESKDEPKKGLPSLNIFTPQALIQEGITPEMMRKFNETGE